MRAALRLQQVPICFGLYRAAPGFADFRQPLGARAQMLSPVGLALAYGKTLLRHICRNSDIAPRSCYSIQRRQDAQVPEDVPEAPAVDEGSIRSAHTERAASRRNLLLYRAGVLLPGSRCSIA